MNESEQRINTSLAKLSSVTQEETIALVKKMNNTLSGVSEVFSEHLIHDDVKFKQMFLMSYADKEKLNIVSNFLGLNRDMIAASPKIHETIKFTAHLITVKLLAEIFESLSHVMELTIREFTIIWKLMNETGEMKSIFFSKSLEPSHLEPSVKLAYERELAEQKLDKIALMAKQSIEDIQYGEIEYDDEG